MKASQYNIEVDYNGSVYVFNGVTGALIKIPKYNYDLLHIFLSNQENCICPPKLLEQLIRGKMLVADEVNELDFLSLRYKAGREDTSNFSLTIVTSLGCNFDCTYCFEEKYPSILMESVQTEILEVIDHKLPTIDRFKVTWYGGEPLLGKRELLKLSDKFIERCISSNVEYSASIITNGYLLDKTTSEQLRDRLVTFAQITLDGPPGVHNRMRPHANGDGTFSTIIENIHNAVDNIDIEIRVNLDKSNVDGFERLLQILLEEGLAGKLRVYPAQIVKINNGSLAPSTAYKPSCFTNAEFARKKLELELIAEQYGFFQRSLPAPTSAPCTAVKRNELVVGSKGELFKCWDSTGNYGEVIGHICDHKNTNDRMEKWLNYDPFSNEECQSCIALPVCMGGCAHHAIDPLQYENRCISFRHTYQEQVLTFVRLAEERGIERIAPVTHLSSPMELTVNEERIRI